MKSVEVVLMRGVAVKIGGGRGMGVARGVLLMILEKSELAKNRMEKKLFSHRITRGKVVIFT